MATCSFHRLIMGKAEIDNLFLSQWEYLDFLQKYLMRYALRFIRLLSKLLNLIGCQVDKKVNISENVKKYLLRNHKVDEADTLYTRQEF